MGEACFSGDGGASECFRSMVVLTATLLMDQLLAWYQHPTEILEFNPVDNSEIVALRRVEEDVIMSARGRILGRENVRGFLSEVLRACVDLKRSFVSRLDEHDAGRYDFEAALGEFEDFLRWS